MKKTLCVILSLIFCAALFLTGCGGNTPGTVEDGTDGDASGSEIVGLGDVRSDNEIEEGETVVETVLGSEVSLFLTGKYYMEGTIYSSGESMPVQLASDGKNFHFTTTMSNISIGVLILDDKTYLIQPKPKVYTELSDTLVKALGIEDEVNISEITNFNLEDEAEAASKINQSAVTINGECGICNEYVYEDTVVKLYSIGDKLIQVDNYNTDGVLTMQIVIDTITKTIPATQLTLKGITKSSVSSFIAAFVSNVQ